MVKIGIIGAMSVEVEHLQQLLKKAEPVKKSGLSFYEGMLNGTQVVVVQCGVGKVNAALCTALLISYFGVTHVINTGVAGAVRKDLHLFDVVVSTDAVHHDVNVSAFGYKPCELPGIKRIEFPANPFLIECARRIANYLGSAREAVSRVLKEIQKQGHIEQKRGMDYGEKYSTQR